MTDFIRGYLIECKNIESYLLYYQDKTHSFVFLASSTTKKVKPSPRVLYNLLTGQNRRFCVTYRSLLNLLFLFSNHLQHFQNIDYQNVHDNVATFTISTTLQFVTHLNSYCKLFLALNEFSKKIQIRLYQCVFESKFSDITQTVQSRTLLLYMLTQF